jgi:hypothetical protein
MRTVVGLFDRFEEAQQVVHELRDAGFRGEEINLIARDADGEYTQSLDTDRVTGDRRDEDVSDGAGAGAGIGAVLGGIAGFLVGLGALAIPGVGPVIAAGPIVGALGGAGIGAVGGGLIGALVDWGVPDEHANYYAEGVRRGGTLVAVRAEDERVDRALQIMNRHNPVDIERHAQQWRQEKWNRFDPNAEPLTGDRMQYNRRTGMGGTVRDRDYHSTAQGDFEQTRDRTEVPITGDRDRTMDYDRTMDQDRTVDRGDYTASGRTTMESGGAMGGVQPTGEEDWDRYEPMYRQHYQSSYGMRGKNYDAYRPAYRFGYEMARSNRYTDYDWNRAEPEARREWERLGGREQSTWDEIRDAVHHAWESVRR